MSKILVVATWWTIDKEYSTKKGTRDSEIWNPAIERILDYGRLFWITVLLKLNFDFNRTVTKLETIFLGMVTITLFPT